MDVRRAPSRYRRKGSGRPPDALPLFAKPQTAVPAGDPMSSSKLQVRTAFAPEPALPSALSSEDSFRTAPSSLSPSPDDFDFLKPLQSQAQSPIQSQTQSQNHSQTQSQNHSQTQTQTHGTVEGAIYSRVPIQSQSQSQVQWGSDQIRDLIGNHGEQGRAELIGPGSKGAESVEPVTGPENVDIPSAQPQTITLNIKLPSRNLAAFSAPLDLSFGDIKSSVVAAFADSLPSDDAQDWMFWEYCPRWQVRRPVRDSEYVRIVTDTWMPDDTFLELSSAAAKMDETSLAFLNPRRDLLPRPDAPGPALLCRAWYYRNHSDWKRVHVRVHGHKLTLSRREVPDKDSRVLAVAEFEPYDCTSRSLGSPSEHVLVLRSQHRPDMFVSDTDALHFLSFAEHADYDVMRNLVYTLRSQAVDKLTRSYVKSRSEIPVTSHTKLIDLTSEPATAFVSGGLLGDGYDRKLAVLQQQQQQQLQQQQQQQQQLQQQQQQQQLQRQKIDPAPSTLLGDEYRRKKLQALAQAQPQNQNMSPIAPGYSPKMPGMPTFTAGSLLAGQAPKQKILPLAPGTAQFAPHSSLEKAAARNH